MLNLTTLKVTALASISALALIACGGDTSEPEPEATFNEPESSAGGADGAGGAGTTEEPEGGEQCAAQDAPTMTDATTLPEGAFECAYTCIPNEQITDFSAETWFGGDWGNSVSLTGNSFDYTGPDTDLPPTLTWDQEGGMMQLSGTVMDYVGWGLAFGPCTDAHRWTGFEIHVGGDLGGAQLDFQVQMNNNYPIDSGNSRGACGFTSEDEKWNECTNNYYTIAEITPEVATYQMPFAEIVGGLPVDGLQPAELLGLQLQFSCGEAEGCPYDVTIDGINFY